MNSKIEQALTRQFEKHRIIFWYDREHDLRDDFEAVVLDDVEKIEINNNEFGLKYRILREAPEQKFLLYHAGPPPDDRDNWLLDVLLAHGEFRTDQVSIWLGDLELSPEYYNVVDDHQEFYRSQKRVSSLKALINNKDALNTIRLKMLAVCARVDAQIDSVLEALLAEFAEDKDDLSHLIERCELDEFLWKQVQKYYGYHSNTPNIKDFAIALFKACYAMGVEENANLNQSALVFFNRWKNNRQHGHVFETLSEKFATTLAIQQDLENRDYAEVIKLDYFKIIDRMVISGLVQDVANKNITLRDCNEALSFRRNGHWYNEHKHMYQAIGYAAMFINALDEIDLSMSSAADGFQRYTKTWYKVDQYYRQFTYHLRKSSQHTLLHDLAEHIENQYTNNYLLTLNNRWQVFVDDMDTWHIDNIKRQRDFFADEVALYLSRSKSKIYVIISDALRYEVADELAARINSEDRYQAEVEARLSVIPSYTQLGMAALLPNTELSINDGSVLVDGKSSQGTENRNAILSQATDGQGRAMQAEEFAQLTRDEARDIARKHDVIYLYHNRIDAVGDKRDTEERVYEAVEDAFEDLLTLIKKLANANANNILITADHGFIYQNKPIDESDYLGDVPAGHEIISIDRRFVLGRGLQAQNSFKSFTGEQAGLTGDIDIQIPKSINRLRKKGSGSRYVHGGTSLQEVVIPVIRINKQRTSDVRQVEVSIIRGVNTVITAGQLTVKLFQEESVSAKVKSRALKIALYSSDNVLISTQHEIIFDSIAEDDRDREKLVQLILSKEADNYNNKNVYVKIFETEEGTSHMVERESVEYRLRRSFTSDFDF